MKSLPAAAVLVTFLSPLASCNGRNAATSASEAGALEASAPAVESSAPPSATASASVPLPPPVRHRGLVGLFFRAAQDANLTDDEKESLTKLEDPVRDDPGPRHEIAAYHSDLVVSIKAGRIDSAKIQADETAITKAYESREEQQATALSGLHDALTTDQRKAVVDALRTMQAAHEHTPSPVSDAGVSEAVTRRLERMRIQLALDDEQQRQVAYVLSRSDVITPSALQARIDASKKQMDAVVGAFEKDAFDAKKVELSPFPGRKPTESMQRQVKYISQLLPILRPEQRDRLAALVEHPHMDHGHGGGGSIIDPIEVGEGRGHSF